jgi:hypothetical protein
MAGLGLLALLPTALFLLSFQLKIYGWDAPLRFFYHFDRLIFDAGDLLLGVILPSFVVAACLFLLLKRKVTDRPLIFTAGAALFLLTVVVTVYAITDPLFEKMGTSIYGF